MILFIGILKIKVVIKLVHKKTLICQKLMNPASEIFIATALYCNLKYLKVNPLKLYRK